MGSLSDINWLGAFDVPVLSGNRGLEFGTGLTHRDTGTEVTLFALDSVCADLVEFSIPPDGDLRSAHPFNKGTFLNNYGNIVQDKLWSDRYDGRGSGDDPPYENVPGVDEVQFGHLKPNNIHFHHASGKMVWTYVAGYDGFVTSADEGTCIGTSTMNFTNHTGVGDGMWKIGVFNYDGTGAPLSDTGPGGRWVYGAWDVPPAWAAMFANGMDLGIGGSGPPNVFPYGPASMGPSFACIGLPNVGVTSNRSRLPAMKQVLYHPYHTTDVAPFRGLKPPDLWCPDNGKSDAMAGAGLPPDDNTPGLTNYNKWTWGDTLGGCTTWVHGANKSFLLALGRFVGGNCNSTVEASPAPTATTFRAVNAGDIRVGDKILVATENTYSLNIYPYASFTVTGRSGNDITVTGGTWHGTLEADPSYVGTVGNIRPGGLVFAGVKYVGGGQFVTRYQHGGLLYSPATLAASAGLGGAVPIDQVAFDNGGTVELPGLTYPITGGAAGNDASYLRAVTFVPRIKRVFVRISNAATVGDVQNQQYARIAVGEIPSV